MFLKHLDSFKKFQTKYECFDVQIQDKILKVIMNRSKPTNTLNWEFLSELYHIFKTVNYCDLDIRCVILKSNQKDFSWGLDVKKTLVGITELRQDDNARTSIAMREVIKQMQSSFNQIEKCRVPVICQIRGICLGGAIDMITCCDMIFCDETSKFSIKEAKLAMSPDLGTIQRLFVLSKNKQLMSELTFTARDFNADEAVEVGLVQKIINKNNLDSYVEQIALGIAANSPVAIMVAKSAFVQMKSQLVKSGLKHMQNMNQTYINTDDVMVAVTSFFQKSKPEFPKL